MSVLTPAFPFVPSAVEGRWPSAAEALTIAILDFARMKSLDFARDERGDLT